MWENLAENIENIEGSIRKLKNQSNLMKLQQYIEIHHYIEKLTTPPKMSNIEREINLWTLKPFKI